MGEKIGNSVDLTKSTRAKVEPHDRDTTRHDTTRKPIFERSTVNSTHRQQPTTLKEGAAKIMTPRGPRHWTGQRSARRALCPLIVSIISAGAGTAWVDWISHSHSISWILNPDPLHASSSSSISDQALWVVGRAIWQRFISINLNSIEGAREKNRDLSELFVRFLFYSKICFYVISNCAQKNPRSDFLI